MLLFKTIAKEKNKFRRGNVEYTRTATARQNGVTRPVDDETKGGLMMDENKRKFRILCFRRAGETMIRPNGCQLLVEILLVVEM
jgi:hypothetical protein